MDELLIFSYYLVSVTSLCLTQEGWICAVLDVRVLLWVTIGGDLEVSEGEVN